MSFTNAHLHGPSRAVYAHLVASNGSVFQHTWLDLEVNAPHIRAAWWLAEAQPGGRACLPGPGPAGAHLIHQQALLQQAGQQGLQHSPTCHWLPAGWSHDEEVNVSCTTSNQGVTC